MAPSAQAQVRQTYSALMEKVASHGLSEAELANAYGDFGKVLMAADQRDTAELSLLDAQLLAPSDVRWPYYLGHLYLRNGDLTRASTSFERALELKPDEIAALVWLGNVLLDQGRAGEAEPRFERALSVQPDSVSARFGLGRAALAKQDYQKAVDALEAVLRQNPEASAAEYPLAMAYRGLGDTAKAEAHLRRRSDNTKILPADPLMAELDHLLESPQAYESRGIEALNNKDWAGAAALFRKGLELAPDHAALRHRLGTALYMQGDVRSAQEQFEQVVRASPDYYLAQFSLGVLLQANGRDSEAIDHFSAALRTRPNYPEAQLRLASSLRRSGRAKESLRQYEQVLAGSPDNSEARIGETMVLVKLGRYLDARDLLASGARTYPDQPIFAHGLARLLATAPDDHVRDGEQSITLIQTLLQKEQRTPELGETLAMALAAVGRYDEAVAVQRDLMMGAERAGLHAVNERLSRNLVLYQHQEPCRTPWADEEMP
jgi:tetratricopeptide (TPR) repeat protein